MNQSAFVSEVLNSEEFKTWAPKEREYLELTKVANLLLGFVFSAGIASLCVLFTSWRIADPGSLALRIGGLTVFLLMVYIAIVGFGKTRIIRFDREHLEIGSTEEILLKCPWSEILEVRFLRNSGFEVISAKGTAQIWWPTLSLETNPYSTFLRQVLIAMSRGPQHSLLTKYKVPVDLAEGETYEYRLGAKNLISPFSMIFGLCFALIPLNLYSMYKHQDLPMGILRLVPVALLLAVAFIAEATKRNLTNKTKIRIHDQTVEVESPKGVSKFPLQKVGDDLKPSMAPIAFTGAEYYGTEEKSIQIDRRFLVKLTES